MIWYNILSFNLLIMAGSNHPHTLTDLFNLWPVNSENRQNEEQEALVEDVKLEYPDVTKSMTMDLKSVLTLEITNLETALLFLKYFPKVCSVKTVYDERAKYDPWTNRRDILFTKLDITPYVSDPSEENINSKKKSYKPWSLETVKLAADLIKDCSVVSFYHAIAVSDQKWMKEVSYFLKTLEASFKKHKYINLTKWKKHRKRKAA